MWSVFAAIFEFERYGLVTVAEKTVMKEKGRNGVVDILLLCLGSRITDRA